MIDIQVVKVMFSESWTSKSDKFISSINFILQSISYEIGLYYRCGALWESLLNFEVWPILKTKG